ncbi:MAG: hypothetical protein ABI877_04020 [Gemmatimonadaceae bacterium]
MSAKVLLQCLCIHIKGSVEPHMSIDGLDDCVCDISRFLPVRLEPLLELSYFTPTLHLDIELDVLCQPRRSEVAGTNESL